MKTLIYENLGEYPVPYDENLGYSVVDLKRYYEELKAKGEDRVKLVRLFLDFALPSLKGCNYVKGKNINRQA
jgi:hypothetical protein